MGAKRKFSNVSWVLLSTVIAGGVAYLVQLFAPALLKNEDTYVAFSILWAAIYLGVSALSGVQQEFSRATQTRTQTPTSDESAQTTLGRAFLVLMAVALGAALIIAAVISAGSVSYGFSQVLLPIVIALVGYLALAVLSGMLAGMVRWPLVAAVLIADAVLRAIILLVGFMLQWDALVLAYAIAVPFGLTAFFGALAVRRVFTGAVAFDEPARGLITNSFTTVLGAVAMGAVVSGLPLLIGVTMPGAEVSWVAGALFAILITRAPIVTPAIALQSYIVSTFRGPADAAERSQPEKLGRKLSFGALVLVVLTALATWIGPYLVRWFSAGRLAVSHGLMLAIIVGAVLTAVLSASAALLIARSYHRASAAGWVVTALLTIALLLVPLAYELRLSLALVLAPAAGLVVHAVWLRRAQPTE